MEITSAASCITRHMETLVGLTAPLRLLPQREALPVPATGNRRETHIVGKSPLAVDPPTKRADVSGECQTREITTRFKRATRRGCSLLNLESVGAPCRVHDRLMAPVVELHSVYSPAARETLPARCAGRVSQGPSSGLGFCIPKVPIVLQMLAMMGDRYMRRTNIGQAASCIILQLGRVNDAQHSHWGIEWCYTLAYMKSGCLRCITLCYIVDQRCCYLGSASSMHTC